VPRKLEDIRDRLIDELERMFADEQCDMSLRTLARRAGIAVGTIYNYFPDKDELVKALFEREWTRTIAEASRALEELDARDTRDPLDAVLGIVYDKAASIARTHPGRRQLFRSLDRSRKEAAVPYPFRPEGWVWVANAFAPVWSKVAPAEAFDAERATIVLVSSLPRLLMVYPNEREANISFLKQALHGVLRNESER
jgi:AcrR family transcriptional regulator